METDMKDYNPLEFEENIYSWWEESGFFKASDSSDAPPYCIVIPPPNVTGALHMGHALTNVIQDTIIRWRRMQGYNTLWLPGTDHAGIATQAVVERNLRREGTSRHELGRERFLEEVWKWKEQYGARITGQLRRLGSSLDWSRERFTMDEGLSNAVNEVFVRLHEQGLLYRDNRLINWCPSCRTALSNLEVEHEGHEGNFYHINYPVVDAQGNPTTDHVTVATTRPETMLGDTAVAVHPEPEKALTDKIRKAEKDLEGSSEGERPEKEAQLSALRSRMEEPVLSKLKWLASLIGSSVLLPLTGRSIPVVGDLHADPALGTGAVKITPGHDFNDFEVGKRQQLERINILNEDGSLNENCGEYAGLSVLDARLRVVEDLTAQGYLDHTEPRDHEVGHCSRCEAVVEPMLSLQWFVDAKPLAEKAVAAVREKQTEIIPPMWEKVFYHWMENIEDWCVSRQLWWGHRIPAWYCDHGHITVARQTPSCCSVCGDASVHQDEDVLDTWFSSALWPFSTLGWPEETPALATFYPNALMETGFDILFFWVARMMMMGIHFLDEVPFKKVFLHAMVRDNEGRKMSKSLGNTIDPLDVIAGISLPDLLAKVEAALPPESEKESRKHRILEGISKKYPQGIEVHGTDALRFTLAVMAAQGRDVKLDM
ncbi:valine--tRNA ligase, partial [Myxococcota bacterium]|nr:valine--tRNA ligase [Myxococcota bacterium]